MSGWNLRPGPMFYSPITKNLLLLGVWLPTTILALVLALLNLSSFSLAKSEKNSPKIFPPAYSFQNPYQMYAALPQVLGNFETAIATADARPEIIRQFLKRHRSPLLPSTDFLITTADKYGLDYRLLVAIAMQESNLCKKIPENSFNCWGFGIYGDKVLRFKNYEEGVETVAKSLREHYVNKGFVTPEQVMAKYAPPSLEKGGAWAKGITQFFQELE